MARQPRTHVDGYPLHIVQRGHNRGRCFFADVDYQLYRDWLLAAVKDAECQLHAYVLMSNHVHLLITPTNAVRMPEVMESMGRHYVPYINRRYERSGSLWERRYHSSLITTDEYLLACYRYIELNPVRAGIAKSPDAYPWSSFRANAWGEAHPGLTPHTTYLELGRDEASRRIAYRSLFETQLREDVLMELRRSALRSRPTGRSRKNKPGPKPEVEPSIRALALD
jgi:putative transposase